MDFARAFSFPFSDPDWVKKIILPALVGLIPLVGGIYLSGWMIDVLRRVQRGDPTPLPDTINFGEYLVDGLKVFVIGLVYSLPMLILLAPWLATIIIASNGTDEATIGSLTLLSTCCCGFGVLYMLFIGFVMPAVYGAYANNSSIGTGFRFGEIMGLIKRAPGAYVMVVAGWIVVSLLISVATAIPYIGTVIAATYGQAVIAHLSAQAYLQARGSGSAFDGGARVYPA